jgi:hypothetical protein
VPRSGRPYAAVVTRFLAIYNGTADELDRGSLSKEEQIEFMNAWASWAQTHQPSLVDPGAPLFMKKRVTAQGVEDFTDSKTGYTIVEAGSHDEAVQLFAEHPHLHIMQGNSIEVLECPPAPGQAG